MELPYFHPRGNFLLQTLSSYNTTIIVPPNYTYLLTFRLKLLNKLDIFVSKIPHNLYTQISNLLDPALTTRQSYSQWIIYPLLNVITQLSLHF